MRDRQPGGSVPPVTAPRRRSALRRVLGGVGWLAAGPVDWAGTRSISRGASLIRGLAGIVREGPVRDGRFRTEEAGAFDLGATAFNYGLSVPALQAALAKQRRHTARVAYATFALGWLFLGGWLWHALSSPLTAGRMASAIDFLPFCVLFFLVAFHQALLNFQLRIGRLASWREYLATDLPFWPC